jgi:hypothetical protein
MERGSTVPAATEGNMNQQNTHEDFLTLGPDDPPVDFSREQAAYEREKSRLVRDHLGQIALIHGDDVIGVFGTADEAFLEGFRRFGLVKTMLKEIRDPEPLEFVSLVDVNHPSVKRLD